MFFADSALLLIALTLSDTQDFLLLWILTSAVSLSGQQRLKGLVVANILYIVVSGVVLFEQTTLGTQLRPGISGLDIVTIRALAVALLFCLIVGLIIANRASRYRHMVSVNLVLLISLVSCSIHAQQSGAQADVIRETTLLYSKYFWAIAFSLLSLKDQPKTESWTALASLTFWTPMTHFHIGAIPRGVGELLACEQKSVPDLKYSRRSGIVLVAIGGIIAAVNSGISTVLFKLQYPFHLLPQLSSDFLTTTAPISLLWGDTLVHGLQYFTRFAAKVSIAVGLIRFAGFHIPLAQFEIWKARNFSDLFRRVYFYYSETLTYFFYFPIWNAIRRLHLPRAIEASASLFGSVLFGGLIIHCILDVPYFIDGDFDRLLLLTASRLPYLFMLALLSTLSSVFFKGRQHHRSTAINSLRNGARALVLFVVYLFCLGLALPTVNQLAALTAPLLDWRQLYVYITKMLGL